MGSSYDEKFEFNAPKVRHGPTRATGEGHRVCGIVRRKSMVMLPFV